MNTSKESRLALNNTTEFEDQLVRLSRIPKELAILPINDAVVYPLMKVPLLLSDPKLLRLADEALAEERVIGAFTQTDPDESKPGPEGIYKVGTAVHIQKMI